MIYGTRAQVWALAEDGETFNEEGSRLTIGEGVLTYRDENGTWTSLPLSRVLMVAWANKPRPVASL